MKLDSDSEFDNPAGDVPANAPWKLTQSLLPQYANRIPPEVLPRTFKEAVQITRKLGEKYLWIDSLCIIQDSKEDWIVESSIMSDIYTGGLCTLSAASNSAKGGLIVPRNVNDGSPVELQLCAIGDRSHIERVILLPDLNYGNGILPVRQRAWCLQEQELSTRMIQFTSLSFLWTCQFFAITEAMICGSALLYTASSLEVVIRRTATTPRTSGLFTPTANTDEFTAVASSDYYFFWYHILEQFSTKGITQPSDRLPALKGVMRRHMLQNPDVYVHGLWEADLLDGVQWQASPSCALTDRRPVPTIAPSWSPLCLNAPIKIYNRHTGHPKGWRRSDTHQDVIQYYPRFTVQYESQIPSTHLLVRGQLKEVEWKEKDWDDGSEDAYPPRAVGSLVIRKKDGVIYDGGRIYWDTLTEREASPSVVCFFCCEEEPEYGGIAGLALIPTSADKKEFMRVGMVRRIHVEMFAGVEPSEFTIV